MFRNVSREKQHNRLFISTVIRESNGSPGACRIGAAWPDNSPLVPVGGGTDLTPGNLATCNLMNWIVEERSGQREIRASRTTASSWSTVAALPELDSHRLEGSLHEYRVGRAFGCPGADYVIKP